MADFAMLSLMTCLPADSRWVIQHGSWGRGGEGGGGGGGGGEETELIPPPPPPSPSSQKWLHRYPNRSSSLSWRSSRVKSTVRPSTRGGGPVLKRATVS